MSRRPHILQSEPWIPCGVKKFDSTGPVELVIALLRRLKDLKPFLHDAVDTIEAELGIDLSVKAAGRVFRPTTPPDRL